MRRTLVLVVDRDDDFGVKANVITPAIGLDTVSRAASMLGVADPEDSDVNSIYAAIKIYNELKAEKKDVEIALICGDRKVGYKSDTKMVDELEKVIEEVAPERAILVSDGAEDEYVYPIITSRIKVDSVKKVYVKQAPGIEGTFYILMKILRDDDKRKRILAPLGIVLMLISTAFIFSAFISYLDSGNLTHFYDMTGVFIVFAIGLVSCLYSYKVKERFMRYAGNILNNVKSGDPTVLFLMAAIVFLILGMVLGLLAALTPHSISSGQRILVFISNSMWMFIFAYICNDFGKFLKRYIEEQKVMLGFLVGTMMIFALAFIMQAALDTLAVFLEYNIISRDMIILELVVGFAFASAAIMTQRSYKSFMDSEEKKAEQSDAFQ